MESVAARFNEDVFGRQTDRVFTIDREHCIRFAEATNDANPLHASGELAPPVFSVTATVPLLQSLLDAVIPSSLAPLKRGVHGEQDMFFHRPVTAGETLTVRVQLIGVRPRSTGTVIISRAEIIDAGAELVQEHFMTNFFRQVETDQVFGVEAPALDLGSQNNEEVDAAVTYRFDVDQSLQYAEASGDRTSFHVDDAAAREAGFNGVIVHGLCTFAFVSRAVIETVCDGDPRRLKRLGARFSKVIYPSDAITTRLWSIGAVEDEKIAHHRLESFNSAGDAVIRNGVADVSEYHNG